MKYLLYIFSLFLCTQLAAQEMRGVIEDGEPVEQVEVPTQTEAPQVDAPAVKDTTAIPQDDYKSTLPELDDEDSQSKPAENNPPAPSRPSDDLPPPQGQVNRAYFTSGVEGHEPIDNLLSLANDQGSVYFFTDLRQFEGQRITHRWLYKNNVLAEVSFNVGGPRWRVWSKKTLLPDWIGEIKVNVVDEHDRILAAETLNYTQASSY